MEREQLARLAEAPSDTARKDLPGLDALAAEFPWFAGAQLLRSVGEAAAGEVHAEDTVHRAALHVPSRAMLYDLLHVERPRIDVDIPQTKVTEDRVVQKAPQPADAIPNASVLIDPGVSIVPPPVTPLTDELTHEEPAPKGEPLADPLDDQILEAAIASAYDLTWTEQIEAPTTELPHTPESTLVREEEEKEEERFSKAPSTPLLEKAHEPITRVSKLRFTDWLERSVEPEGESSPSEEKADITTGSNDPEVPEALPAEIRPTALVERFIKQQTAGPVKKVEFYTPQQAAKRSLDDSAGLVTETLARIYAKQGNLPKAIDAYGRLALKYPEKSAYFAALSKELEGQLNT